MTISVHERWVAHCDFHHGKPFIATSAQGFLLWVAQQMWSTPQTINRQRWSKGEVRHTCLEILWA